MSNAEQPRIFPMLQQVRHHLLSRLLHRQRHRRCTGGPTPAWPCTETALKAGRCWRASIAGALHRHELHPRLPWGSSNSDHPLIEGCRYFRELHRDYPEALFILNTRDPFDWLRSRLQHDQGQFAAAYQRALAGDGIQNQRQLKRRWLQDWYEHHADVLSYFQSTAPRKLLTFHIQATPVRQLNRFLQPHFPISQRSFPHHHQSAKRES